jgi:hypothetical protein
VRKAQPSAFRDRHPRAAATALRVRKETGNDGRQPEAIERYPWSPPLQGKQPESGGSRVVGQFVGQERFIPEQVLPASCPALATATATW